VAVCKKRPFWRRRRESEKATSTHDEGTDTIEAIFVFQTALTSSLSMKSWAFPVIEKVTVPEIVTESVGEFGASYNVTVVVVGVTVVVVTVVVFVSIGPVIVVAVAVTVVAVAVAVVSVAVTVVAVAVTVVTVVVVVELSSLNNRRPPSLSELLPSDWCVDSQISTTWSFEQQVSFSHCPAHWTSEGLDTKLQPSGHETKSSHVNT
jgi:hypothetical protein